jgi:tryptophan synthase alpha subunit
VNALASIFRDLRRRGLSPVIPYITAGYPSLDATGDILQGVARLGLPLVEVGLPFSDPVADGPVIQAASTAALRNGTTTTALLRLLKEICPGLQTGVIVMTYANPVLAHGPERFLRDLEEAGVAGLLPVDLPPDDFAEFLPGYRRSPVGVGALVAPNSSAQRIRTAAKAATGMLYLTSRLGVTGARGDVPEGVTEKLDLLRSSSGLPVVAGFGFSTASQVALVRPHCDGIVIGSALVEAMAGRSMGEAAGAYLAALRGLIGG